MTLDFNRIPILTEEENDLAFKELLKMKNIWFSRTNWQAEENISIEDYVHYYTVGATLYMDARDKGWKYYNRLYPKYNQVLKKKLQWLYDKFLIGLQKELGQCEYEEGLGLPGFNIYEFDDAPSDRKHHRCLHYDAQWWYGKKYFKRKYDDIDFDNQLSYTFSIKVPHNGAAIALWNLPESHYKKANDIKYMIWRDIIHRYETVEYVKEIKESNTIEDPWKFKLFDNNCGDLDQYIPHIIPHIEGYSFYYYGMIMHQMILGDSFKKGDYRITLQGHGLKCDGKWRLFW